MNSSPLLPYAWMLASASAFSVMAICTRALGPLCDWKVIAIFRAGLAMVFAAMLVYHAGVAVFIGPLPGEMPSEKVGLAFLFSLGGCCLRQPPQAIEGQLAFAAALLSSFTSGIALIGLHKLKQLDPRAIVTHFSGVALMLSIVACFVFQSERETAMSVATGCLLLGVGLSATAGQLFLTKAFTTGNAARVAVVGLSQVAIVMLLEILIWQRSFSLQTLAGMGLVVAPTAWMILRRAQ